MAPKKATKGASGGGGDDDGSDTDDRRAGSGGGGGGMGGMGGNTGAVKLTDQMILVSSLIAEADLFTRHADYPAAIQLYTRALELKPGHVHLLICRSRCRALQGDTTGALKDADEILAQDAKSARGIMCKADALFAAGDFEMAMVWYHRGDRLRGEHVEFKRGVVRCREAIERAMMEVDVEKMRAARAAAKARAAAAAAAGPIAANTGGTGRTGGAAAAATFTTSATAAHPGGAAGVGGIAASGRVSGVLPPPHPPGRAPKQSPFARKGHAGPTGPYGATAMAGSVAAGVARRVSPGAGIVFGGAPLTTIPAAAAAGGAAASGGTPRRALSQQRASELIDHNLLEELFEDYGFLKDLQGDDVFMAAGDGQIGEYVTDAIKYLDGRIEFWRARNPRGLHESTVVDAIQPRRRSLVGPQGKYVAPH